MTLNWNGRTYLRVFLLVAGSAFLVWGAIQGSAVDAGLGAVAVLLGGVGLAWEWRENTAE